MIMIRKGTHTAMVTMGAFKAVFEGQGWEISENTSSMHKKPDTGLGMKLPDPDQEDDTEDENFQEDEDTEEDLTEKPLSSLSMGELQQLASLRGVDTEGMRTKREIRAAIREAMEEED